MPRIQAPTVAEHRARRIRAILDAARSLIEETSEPPSMGDVAERAGLARSSLYQYFASVEKLLSAVASEVFPEWADRVLKRVDAASTPGMKVWAYVEENVAIFSSSELSVAQVLARAIAPQEFHAPMKELHLQLQVPLRQALTDLGDPEPELMAELIDSLIVKSTHGLTDDRGPHQDEASADSLASLRRLIGPYLGLLP